MPIETADLIAAAERAFQTQFEGVIRVEPEENGPIWVDGRAGKPQIGDSQPEGLQDGGAGQCVWRASNETLLRIFEGERLLGSAYLSGRLAIAGDISVMARLELERPRIG